MLNLPLALRIEKNKLISTAPWILLVDVELPDSSHIRIAKNTEDVTFVGNAYSAFSFDLDANKSSNKGEVQSVTLSVANPGQALTPFVEEYSGLVGCQVTIYVVHTDNLSEDYSELTMTFIVVATHVGEDLIQFSLGGENPMRRRFPLYNSLPNSCGWIFKGAECGYSGSATSCDRMLTTCKALGNTKRFGGRPGLLGAPKFR